MSKDFTPVELVSGNEIITRFVDNDLTAIHAGKKMFVINTDLAGAQGLAMSITMQDCTSVTTNNLSSSDLLSFSYREDRFVIMAATDRDAWVLCGMDTRQTKSVANFFEDAFIVLPASGGKPITVTDCANALGLPKVDGAYRYEVNGL